MTIATLRRRLERLVSQTGRNDPCRGLAQRLAAARSAADQSDADNEENDVERYHRIKHSDDPKDKAESDSLRRAFWPQLYRR